MPKSKRSQNAPRHDPDAVEHYIGGLAAEDQVILQQARNVIKDMNPTITECIKWALPFFEYYGNLCYMGIVGGRLLMGFYRGSILDDPYGLLQGEGKQVRHVDLRRPGILQHEGFALLLQQGMLLNEQKRKA